MEAPRPGRWMPALDHRDAAAWQLCRFAAGQAVAVLGDDGRVAERDAATASATATMWCWRPRCSIGCRRGISSISTSSNRRQASNWFSKRYLHRLEHCRAVLEYKQSNMEYLAERGIVFPHVYALPIGGNPELFQDDPSIDLSACGASGAVLWGLESQSAPHAAPGGAVVGVRAAARGRVVCACPLC
jgi:hypothetical protein